MLGRTATYLSGRVATRPATGVKTGRVAERLKQCEVRRRSLDGAPTRTTGSPTLAIICSSPGDGSGGPRGVTVISLRAKRDYREAEVRWPVYCHFGSRCEPGPPACSVLRLMLTCGGKGCCRRARTDSHRAPKSRMRRRRPVACRGCRSRVGNPAALAGSGQGHFLSRGWARRWR